MFFLEATSHGKQSLTCTHGSLGASCHSWSPNEWAQRGDDRMCHRISFDFNHVFSFIDQSTRTGHQEELRLPYSYDS